MPSKIQKANNTGRKSSEKAAGSAVARSALKEKLFAAALKSREFHDELNDAAREIYSAAKQESTEATIAGVFERTLYAVLRDVGLKFNPEKEDRLDTKRHIGHGRMDSRIGAVVIEYKRPSKLKTDAQIGKARVQLGDYLTSLSEKLGTATYGFLTDGKKCYEMYVIDARSPSQSKQFLLNGECLLRLTKSIYSLQLTALTSKNLIRDFCSSDGSGAMLDAARTMFNVLMNSSSLKTRMLREEWEEIFRLGHDDHSQQRRIQERTASLAGLLEQTLTSAADEYVALFALHTAYALVVKLMAYRVVSELRLRRQLVLWNDLVVSESEPLRVFCSGLEEGEIFRKLGILNLLEGDFFSWYSDKNQWNDDLHSSVKTILQVLGRYENAKDLFASVGAVDLFRELYEATVPRPVRSSFGEFYTPHWLAEHVIGSTKPEKKWRCLDPCSGSGTFVVAAIERVRIECQRQDKKAVLNSVLSRVVAIDLNPLAVLTTRVNYFIHISDLLEDNLPNLIIPVFLGDGSYVPARKTIGGVECVEYRLKTLKQPIDIRLPFSFVKDTVSFLKTMLDFEHAVQRKNIGRAAQVILGKLNAKERVPHLIRMIMELSAQLVRLEKRGWNGIWARIITNFLTTATLERFDIIVGNPPWIDWKNLPEGYRDKIKSLCIDRGLFSGDGRTGGINLNVCALISHVCISNWLKDDGRLAFLMPKELAVQQSYQGWRRLAGKERRSFHLFVDWSGVGHPFDPVKEDFMTYVIGKWRKGYTVSVVKPVRNDNSRKAKHWKNLFEAKENFKVESHVAGQIIPGSSAYTFARDLEDLTELSLVAGECAYIGREGIEFYPQELLLFRFDSLGPTANTVYLRNIQIGKSKYRVPAHTKLFESDYIFPLVKGSNIKPFYHEYDSLLVPFPYRSDDAKRPVSMDVLDSQSPLLLQFYRDFEKTIRSQTEFSDKIRGLNAGEFYGLARTGPYSFAGTWVCFRDNTNWCAAVVTGTDLPWIGKKMFVFQNHAVSMCERASGGFISEEEAHYICAILNAPRVKRFINASSDQRSFKIRPPVYVPEFIPMNERHVRLSQLSQDAHREPETTENILHEIQTIYLSLCREKQFTLSGI